MDAETVLNALATGDITPGHARQQLATYGRADPEAGHAVADQIAELALDLIAQGQPDPARFAGDVALVLTAEFERWYA